MGGAHDELQILKGTLCQPESFLCCRYLQQAFREEDFYGLFQDGQQSAMMDPDPPLQKRQHVLHLSGDTDTFSNNLPGNTKAVERDAPGGASCLLLKDSPLRC